MKRKISLILVITALIVSLFQTSALESTSPNEKIYELLYYDTNIMVSNVISDNSDKNISIINLENEDGPYQIKIVSDLYIEAAAPCRVTYSFGDQYINIAKKDDDGSYTSDYSKPRIEFDRNKYTLFSFSENGIIKGATVDNVDKAKDRYAGADGNYVTLGEGVYIVSNYSPEFRGAGGQSFSDYKVILTVKKPTVTASPTDSTVYVNGMLKQFDAYSINGNNYFKLRDLASVLSGTSKQFEVKWDEQKNAINLLSAKAYSPVGGEMARNANPVKKNAVLSDSSIYVDGQLKAMTAYTINGNNYFKLRDIAKIFNFGVAWDEKTNSIAINTLTGYTE
ncbi:MAG: hypothetical protein AB9835_02735 [Eubacteriales bacterium]